VKDANPYFYLWTSSIMMPSGPRTKRAVSRVACQRTDRDLSTFGAQLFHCRINIVYRQPDMLRPVMRKGRCRHVWFVRVRRRYQHLLATSRIVMRCCPG
jgi:hypothetical protein